MKKFVILIIAFSIHSALAQNIPLGFPDDDLNVGSDIFQDFNEDIESTQVAEDERFYRYSRFYSVMLGLGYTTFTGNRGLMFEDNHPSFNFGLLYFLNFQNAFVMGLSYSSHTAYIDTYVFGSQTEIIGQIDSNMLRAYMGFRYYVDTTDLGTAITYSNPYFVGRVEYWYQTVLFPDLDSKSKDDNGGLGTGVGFGLEFPVEIKESYFNVEFLYHIVLLRDKNTSDYAQIPSEQEDQDSCGGSVCESEYGYDNLSGDVITIMFNYVISW